MTKRSAIHLLLMSFLLFSGCERPFIEPTAPRVKILSPNTQVVNTTGTTELIMEASSFRNIDRVTLNDTPVPYNNTTSRWEATLKLATGLNTYITATYDVENVVHYDTLRIVHYNPNVSTNGAPSLPQPRGGHTTTTLADGSLLVMGGTTSTTLPANNDAWILGANSNVFSTLESNMQSARTGHTANRLADGRVLIIGGSKIAEPQQVQDLVETVEIFDPVKRTFQNIPVVAKDPIRRTQHTAFLYPDAQNPRNSVYVYLFGGRGDIRYGDTPTIGTRQDIRVFQLRNDTLRTASPTFGSLFYPLRGHTQTTIFQSGNQTEARYIIAGTNFDNNTSSTQGTTNSFILDVQARSLKEFTMPAFVNPRTQHAATFFSNNFVLFSGGKTTVSSSAKEDFEIYVVSAKKILNFPSTIGLTQKRFGHTATLWRNGRILVVGGFNGNGSALSTSETITF